MLHSPPDVGIEEIPDCVVRLNGLTLRALHKAKRHQQWEDVMDPSRRRESRREMRRQMHNITVWFNFHLTRICRERNF